MQNVDMKIDKDAKGKPKTMTLTIDLQNEGEESKSGKSQVIATTKGNIDVPGCKGMKIGLNCYTKK